MLDRKIDLNLKSAYSAAGGACRAVIALASAGKAISNCTSNIEKLILEGAEQEKLITALSFAGDFVAEVWWTQSDPPLKRTPLLRPVGVEFHTTEQTVLEQN